MKKNDVLFVILFIGICEAAGILGSFFTASAIPAWFETLAKPPLNPPNFVFAPVWTALYALMGISAFLIFKKRPREDSQRRGLQLFFIQLILNVLWSVIFFGLHSILYAFLELIILWCFVGATIWVFYKSSKTAAVLLLPYIMWLCFAAYLNLGFLILN